MTKSRVSHYRSNRSGYAVCGVPLSSNSSTGVTSATVTCHRCKDYLVKCETGFNNCFLLICKVDTQIKWDIVSNPDLANKSAPEYLATQILVNSFVPYVEWENCGVYYRCIRHKDKLEYITEGSDNEAG